MALIFDFVKNNNDIANLLSEKHSQYINEFGIERGQGFADAMNYLMEEIDHILTERYPSGASCPRTPHLVNRDLKKLHDVSNLFLKKLNT